MVLSEIDVARPVKLTPWRYVKSSTRIPMAVLESGWIESDESPIAQKILYEDPTE